MHTLVIPSTSLITWDAYRDTDRAVTEIGSGDAHTGDSLYPLLTCRIHGVSSSHTVMGLRHLLHMVTLSRGICSLTLTILTKRPEGGTCTTR